MRMVDLIEQKQAGKPLSTAAIRWIIDGIVADRIPDYQTAALMMAIYFQGMDRRETVDLTLAMARSGDILDLHDVADFVVDKHSSGGVGDKTTLVVQPLVAACGVPVGKMSGRGLGPSGGTLDKMEAIRGWRSEMSLEQFKAQLGEIGLVLAGQTADLAPADGILYALRDVTATVASMPLIAASIMSKKLASGADGIVLDVKVGSGAFMKTVETGRELAQAMVDIGRDAGRQVTALLADMNQPLGHAVGNALEVAEAIASLRGEGPADLWQHSRLVAAHMLLLSDHAADLDEAGEQIDEARASGAAMHKFCEMVTAQGGDPEQIEHPERLPQARYVETISVKAAGYVAALDTEALGWVAVHLGAGRAAKGDPIDYAVGYELPLKIGDQVASGDPLATIHANNRDELAEAAAAIREAISWSETPVPPQPHLHGVVHS